MNRGRKSARAFRHCAPRGMGRRKAARNDPRVRKPGPGPSFLDLRHGDPGACARRKEFRMHPATPSGGRPAPDPSVVARLFPVLVTAAALLGLIASVAHAGEVHGVVTDPEGRPVAAARVSIVGLLGARTVQSGVDGRFEIANLPEGTYRLLAEAPGLHG